MMKAIVFYSKTGNTKGVAEHIADKKACELLPIIPMVDNTNDLHPELKESPNIQDFDEIIFGSPVHGFSIPNVTRTYLEQTDFTGKKVLLYVTHFFPYAWMGGNRTLKQMKNLIIKKGGEIIDMKCINWKNKKREQDIEALVECFSK